MLLFIVFSSTVFAIIGSLIGRPKGYPVRGFFLGLLFSILGVVIITLMGNKDTSDLD